MSDSDEAAEEPSVHLGFLEPADPRTLLRHRFPSKVGGRPVSASPPPCDPLTAATRVSREACCEVSL